MRLLVALGGNALLHRHERPEEATQAARLAQAAPALVRLAARHEVVFVHGNGPQVGLLARESTDDQSLREPYPLEALVAETQGLIGSLLVQALHAAGLAGPLVALVTHTVVDVEGAAAAAPTKFIGAVYERSRADRLAAEHGWRMARDGDGWRRVVSSPNPLRIVELAPAKTLVDAGTTVVMAGGGGIPISGHGVGRPVEAVIDKDRTAAMLAEALGADLLAILTDVPGVMTDFGTPRAAIIASTTPAQLREHPFPAGSMGPKVDAACDFVDRTGRRAAIGSLEQAEAVVDGTMGTQITSATGRAAPAR